MTVDKNTLDVVLVPLKSHAAKRWEKLGLPRREGWAFVASADGTTILAADEPSEEGMRDQAATVLYPELHTRLVSWWLDPPLCRNRDCRAGRFSLADLPLR
jgi:hypothetical protein